MIQLEELPIELVNGGDCQYHYHRSDRIARQDLLHGLQAVTKVRTTATNLTLVDTDDIVIASADCTISLPPARGEREYKVKKYYAGGAGVVISPAGTDTVEGAASYTITGTGTVKLFKAIGTDWVII